jgi:flagellar biosynthesis protein FlhG
VKRHGSPGTPGLPGERAGRPLRVMARRGPARAAPATPAAAPENHPAHWSRPSVRTLAIASGKGGVGKSNLAANLAVALGARGARVLLLDADFAQANLDLLLGLHPRYDLQHLVAGEKTLEEIVVSGSHGVRLVPAASGAPETAELDDYTRECLLRNIGLLDEEIDLVIIDNATGASRHVTSFCRCADDVLVVCTPELPAFSDAYGLIKLLVVQGLARAPHLIVNQAGSPEEAEETAHRIRLVGRRFLQLEIECWGVVPFDPSVPRAVRLQEPVVTAFPNSPAAAAYRGLAERLWPLPDPEAGLLPHPERLEA